MPNDPYKMYSHTLTCLWNGSLLEAAVNQEFISVGVGGLLDVELFTHSVSHHSRA